MRFPETKEEKEEEVPVPTAEEYLADIRDLLVEQNKAAKETQKNVEDK